MKVISIILAMLISVTVAANTNIKKKEEETKVVLKKGGAVYAFSKDDGFKLTKKAIDNLGVKFLGLGNSKTWDIPKSSIVRIKSATGVYRQYDDWITLVFVNILKKNKDTVSINCVDLQNGDGIAISGVKFLRVTDADLNSDTVDACAH